MQIICSGRGWGKTNYLLRMMKQNPKMVMFCMDYQEVQRLRKDNPLIEPHRFVTFENKPPALRVWADSAVIDNLDMILGRLTGLSVRTVTMGIPDRKIIVPDSEIVEVRRRLSPWDIDHPL